MLPGQRRRRRYMLGVVSVVGLVAAAGLILAEQEISGLQIGKFLAALSTAFGLLAATPITDLFASSQRRVEDHGSVSWDSQVEQLARRVAVAVTMQHDIDNEVNRTFLQGRYLKVHWVNEVANGDLKDTRCAIASLEPYQSMLDTFESYQQVHNRWVVLGAAGSGKTTLMLRLQHELLAAWSQNPESRIPVVFSLASWNPNLRLYDWLTEQLRIRYPALAREAREDLAVVARDRLLPILDGFDEIPEPHRHTALRTLNSLPPSQPFVLTSRTNDFRAHARGAQQVLHHAVVSTLRDLRLEDVADYLGELTNSSAGSWRKAALAGEVDPVAKLLTTPVAVWPIADQPDITPEQLRAMGATSEEIATHLFRRLIRERFAALAVGPDTTRRGGWEGDRAQEWLSVLARYVEQRLATANRDAAGSGRTVSNTTEPTQSLPAPALAIEQNPRDIFWWELADSLQPNIPRISRIASGVVPGTALGLGLTLVVKPVMEPLHSLILGGASGVLLAATAILLGRRTTTVPPTTIELGPMRARLGLVATLFVAMIAAGASILMSHGQPTRLTAMGLLLGAVVGLPYALVNEMDVTRVQSPAAVYERDFRFVWVYALVYGLPCAAFALLANPTSWPWAIVVGLLTASSGGLFNGIPWMVANALAGRTKEARAVGAVAWARFQLARMTWSVAQPRLPWELLRFLDACVQVGLMRQTGAAYQFRHEIIRCALLHGERSLDRDQHRVIQADLSTLSGSVSEPNADTP
jgi:hypothetical protein